MQWLKQCLHTSIATTSSRLVCFVYHCQLSSCNRDMCQLLSTQMHHLFWWYGSLICLMHVQEEWTMLQSIFFSHCRPPKVCTCSSDMASHSCPVVTECSTSLGGLPRSLVVNLSCMCNLYVSFLAFRRAHCYHISLHKLRLSTAIPKIVLALCVTAGVVWWLWMMEKSLYVYTCPISLHALHC